MEYTRGTERYRCAFLKFGIVCTVGTIAIAPFNVTDKDWKFSIDNKMMGQINTIRFGEEYVNDGGALFYLQVYLPNTQ
ncbi:hypothetical protein [Aurantibacter sp.]|uniref:hypothetical protein n=1 Tax=Aurantibacter sp. TaxID=2807103 RepID=UPI003267A0BC